MRERVMTEQKCIQLGFCEVALEDHFTCLLQQTVDINLSNDVDNSLVFDLRWLEDHINDGFVGEDDIARERLSQSTLCRADRLGAQSRLWPKPIRRECLFGTSKAAWRGSWVWRVHCQ